MAKPPPIPPESILDDLSGVTICYQDKDRFIFGSLLGHSNGLIGMKTENGKTIIIKMAESSTIRTHERGIQINPYETV